MKASLHRVAAAAAVLGLVIAGAGCGGASDGTSDGVSRGGERGVGPEDGPQPGLAWDELGIERFTPTATQRRFDVAHYDLALEIDPGRKHVAGNLRVRGRKEAGLAAIDLDFYENFTVRRTLDGREETPGRRLGNAVYRIDLRDAAATTFSVAIEYEGRPLRVDSNSGWTCGLRFDKVRGRDVICTCFQPFFARFLFPCKDHPSDKAEDGCDLRIEVPSALNVVATGHRVAITPTASDYRMHHWRTEYAIATNLMSFSIAEYVELEDAYRSTGGERVKLHHFVLPDRADRARRAFAEVPRVLKIYEERFGPYPFPRDKFSLVETSYSGLENQTAIAYGSEFAAAPGKGEYDYVLVHEAAHEWAGNAVTCRDWRDVWLHEGIATYAEGLYLEARDGAAYYHGLASIWNGKAEDDALTDRDVNSDDDIFRSAIVYSRAAAVLHMLRWCVGDAAFGRGLRRFFASDRHRYGNAATEDFRRVMEESSGRDLRAFFRHWVDGAGAFDAVWDARRVPGGIEIGVKSITGGVDPHELPVLVRVTAGKRFADRRIDVGPALKKMFVPIAGAEWDVELDPDGWLVGGLFERRPGLIQ